MIARFLRDNENKTIKLVWGMDEYIGTLTYHGRDWWVVSGQAFHISQVSTCGNANYPYVVVS